MSDKTIAVFADTAEAYEELCSGARALGGRPVALWAGDEADAQRIAAWGARVMHVGAVPEGALYEDCVPAFQEVVQAEQPTLILARMSKRTQCVAGRLAVRLGVPVVTDASRVKLDDEGVEAAHMAYGGAAERPVPSSWSGARRSRRRWSTSAPRRSWCAWAAASRTSRT